MLNKRFWDDDFRFQKICNVLKIISNVWYDCLVEVYLKSGYFKTIV